MGGFGSGGVSLTTLDTLYQSYRVPGILPLPVYPTNNQGTVESSYYKYTIADELIRVIPFISTGSQPQARQYVARVAAGGMEETGILSSDDQDGEDWVAGTATAGGWELDAIEAIGVRFKKVSLVIRADQIMAAAGASSDDVFQAQVQLASLVVVRELSRAIFQSELAIDGTDGDASSRELVGLFEYLSTSNDVGYSYVGSPPGGYTGSGVAKGMVGGLSHIEALCCPSGGDFGAGPDVFVMSSRARWRLLKELEDAGSTPDFRHSPLTQKVQLHFHGIPVLTGRVREGVVSGYGGTDAWALKLFGPSGVRVLHVGGEPRSYGVRVDRAGPVMTLSGSNEAYNASRGVEVSGVYSIVVPEPNSVARLHGIPAVDPFTQAS